MSIYDSLQYGEWAVSIILLFIVAWQKFSSPPTNRSETTFGLFFFGAVFYFALIIALWLFVIVLVQQGILGLSWFVSPAAPVDPEAKRQIGQFAPLVAALFIVAASQLPKVGEIDVAARNFCINLAAIPREADRLGLELARSADFQPASNNLRNEIEQFISENIDPKAVEFKSDGSMAARFTRAIGLYHLFIAPMNDNRFGFSITANAKSAYFEILEAGEKIRAEAARRYEELVHGAANYFASPRPTREMTNDLNLAIAQISTLTCRLIARYVLYCDITRSGRRHRLSAMGFDARHPMPEFGIDKWAMTIFVVMLISVGMMRYMPGFLRLPGGQVLTISITFAITIGFAVIGAVVVARRFIERRDTVRRPPLGELALAAFIVAGLSLIARFVIPLIPALILNGQTAFHDILTQFVDRLPGVIIPFVCTISLGLLCSYLWSLKWRWYQVALVGALANGIAFMAAGAVVALWIDAGVLAKIYENVAQARVMIPITTGMTGAIIGAIVLAVFRRSERIRQASEDVLIELKSKERRPSLPSSPSRTAARHLGGYTREMVHDLEGRYLCLRPAFTSIAVINAYEIEIRWDEIQTCLIFEEHNRVDAGHLQRGHVYIPDGKPFVTLSTIERGAIRLITLSRSEGKEPARGLIFTLSNPVSGHFTPACAPVVLKVIGDETPQFGFIPAECPAVFGLSTGTRNSDARIRFLCNNTCFRRRWI